MSDKPAFVLILTLFAFMVSKTLFYFPPPKEILPTTGAPTSTINFSDFHLFIPRLYISAPITSNVNGSNQVEYLLALQHGLAQLKGTSLPGNNGNIFIIGHSSFYPDDPGQFKQVFATLDQLKPGDKIYLWRQNKEYLYRVNQIIVVAPTDTKILRATSSEQLTLMTCWPPGTVNNRLVVIAKPQN